MSQAGKEKSAQVKKISDRALLMLRVLNEHENHGGYFLFEANANTRFGNSVPRWSSDSPAKEWEGGSANSITVHIDGHDRRCFEALADRGLVDRIPPPDEDRWSKFGRYRISDAGRAFLEEARKKSEKK